MVHKAAVPVAGMLLALGAALLRRTNSARRRTTITATRVKDWFKLHGNRSPGLFTNNKHAVSIRKPRSWDSLEAPATSALLYYDEQRLYFVFHVKNSSTFKEAAGFSDNGTEWAEEQGMPESMRSILNDDRMEAFLLPCPGVENAANGPYFAFEVNKDGKAIVSKTEFLRKFDFRWKTARCAANGGGDVDNYNDQVESEVSYDDGNELVFVFSVEFADLGLTATGLENGTETLKCGLFRATRMDNSGVEMAWASWVDPEDDVVDFHRPALFGNVSFRKR